MWRAFLLIVLIVVPLVTVRGGSSDLVITENTTWSGVVTGRRSITIAEGAVLTLAPGTSIQFQPGGNINGPGSLQILGTEEAPVFLDGSGWQGIAVSGDVHLDWLYILGALGPFSFGGHLTEFNHVTITDAPDSRLLIQPKDRGSVTLDYLTVDWNIVTRTEGVLDIRIESTFQEVNFTHLTLPRQALLEGREVVHVTGSYYSLNMIAGQTVDGCPIVPITKSPYTAVFQASSSCHPAEPSLLFIPGYGASFNFSYMLNPKPDQPLQDDWSFIPFLTDSYKVFQKQVTERGIKMGVAYYDWRQTLPTIVRDYLIPAIDALKGRDSVSQVYFVAHSFGGLVARYYIESDQYRGDVAGLVDMATPNQGSAKAYSPWEGGVFPSDWQPVTNLVRYYHFLEKSHVSSDVVALRTYIPSGRTLLPTGNVLRRLAGGSPEALALQQNTELLELNGREQTLLRLVPVLFTVAGTGSTTVDQLFVSEPRPRATYWPDGEVAGNGQISSSPGDGTVSVSSASLPHVSQVLFDTAHQEIPSVAADYILERLYPGHPVPPPPPPLAGATRTTTHILWFVFDCPVSVVITTPSARTITSNPGVTDTSAVFAAPEAIWMLLPQEPGNYKLAITALGDTEVRWWQGADTIHTYQMKKGETRGVSYVAEAVAAAPSPSPSAAPLPVISPSIPQGPHLAPQLFPKVTPFSVQSFSQVGLVLYADVPQYTAVPEQVPQQKRDGPDRPAFLLLALPMLFLRRKKRELQGLRRHPP